METQQIIEWLFTEGGPAIRYRTAVELIGQDLVDCGRLADALLQTATVQWLLEQMDRFGPITHVDIRVLNELHGMKPTCLESVVARLLERGLRAGITVFDRKMERFRQYVDNPLVRAALDASERATVEGGRAVFIATVLASHLMRGGYWYDEVVAFVERRIDLLARLAAERNYEIYLSEAEQSGLPKQWSGKPIIRPEMDPMIGTKPLPLIHDFYAFAYLPAGRLSGDTRHKLDEIVSYVMDERYQAFPPGYGYLWSKANRTCYGCGWSVDLPNLDAPQPNEQRRIVQRMELMAHFTAARRSPWFHKGLQLLETFRTERGTYRFPPGYLREEKAGYYVGGEYMGLEDNRRKAQVLELESTFHMLLLRAI